jgi:hypothetical protein
VERFACPNCGPRVAVDKDGCCVTCGGDTIIKPAPAPPPSGEMTREDFGGTLYDALNDAESAAHDLHIGGRNNEHRDALLAHDAALREEVEFEKDAKERAVSQLKYANAEVERLKDGFAAAIDLKNNAIIAAIAERDALRQEIERLRMALSDVLTEGTDIDEELARLYAYGNRKR